MNSVVCYLLSGFGPEYHSTSHSYVTTTYSIYYIYLAEFQRLLAYLYLPDTYPHISALRWATSRFRTRNARFPIHSAMSSWCRSKHLNHATRAGEIISAGFRPAGGPLARRTNCMART